MKKLFTGTNDQLVSLGILLMRIAIGGVMFAHGSQKVLGIFGGKGMDATVSMMSAGLGLPAFFIYLSIFTEFLGGIALLFGALTRFFGIAVLINMLVAVMAVHFKNGFFAPTGFEYPGTLAMIALGIIIMGPGKFSLDRAVFWNERVRIAKPQSTVRSIPNSSLGHGAAH
jgi:putative oxidoreductase